MNKSTLKTIVDKYKEAERQVDQLDELGVCIWNPKKENFYNKYQYIIFGLFNEVYTSAQPLHESVLYCAFLT